MATWVTHLMVADQVLNTFTGLHRRGFCVGNIAPDCNVENEDWTAFTPSREVTHWMQGSRKVASDCDLFYEEYIAKRAKEIASDEQRAFLAGYYAHLIVDAAFQKMIREENRVKAVWSRIKSTPDLWLRAAGLPENWDTVKKLLPKNERQREIFSLEAEYLQSHPDSGYLREILPLTEFPDYIDYLPHGCIVRKIGVMGYIPQADMDTNKLISISREEYSAFVTDATETVIAKFREKGLDFPDRE